MRPMPTPYFGVAGITDAVQVQQLRRASPIRRPGHVTCIGVLASLTTLEGTEAERPPRYPKRYPPRAAWSGIFAAAGFGVHRFLHYNGPNDRTLPAQLAGAMHWAGPHCTGIQLNIAWPDPAAVLGMRTAYPRTDVVLQLSSKALDLAGNDPREVARRVVLEYGTGIRYALLDPSGGTGTALTLEMALRYLEPLAAALEEFNLPVGLGIAGGFGPDSLDTALELLEGFPGLSVDAEGRLRDAQDDLDLIRAAGYLNRLHLRE